MAWYYSGLYNEVFEATGARARFLDVEIMTEKHDPVPGQSIWGPYASRAGAEAARQAHNPRTVIPDVVNNVVPNAANTVVTAVEEWLVRLAEIAVGITLLAIAAHAIITRNTGVSVTGTAVAAAKLIK